MNLLEFDPELPPCFKAWCDCGWKGRVLSGFAYVIGTNAPIEGLEKEYLCPSCKKGSPWSFSSKFHSSVEEGDFEKRFRWVMENRGVQLVRGDELFPCTCEVRPNCRIVDKIVVSACIVGDTAFQCDYSWMRAIARVQCMGCYAKSLVSWLEKFSWRDIGEKEWAKMACLKPFRGYGEEI